MSNDNNFQFTISNEKQQSLIEEIINDVEGVANGVFNPGTIETAIHEAFYNYIETNIEDICAELVKQTKKYLTAEIYKELEECNTCGVLIKTYELNDNGNCDTCAQEEEDDYDDYNDEEDYD